MAPRLGLQPLWSSAMAGVTRGALLRLLAAYVSTGADHHYGWSLLLAGLFLVGFVSVLVLQFLQPSSLRASLSVSMLSILVLGILLLEFAIEGAICLVMALPIAIPVAIFGGLIAHSLRHKPIAQNPATLF